MDIESDRLSHPDTEADFGKRNPSRLSRAPVSKQRVRIARFGLSRIKPESTHSKAAAIYSTRRQRTDRRPVSTQCLHGQLTSMRLVTDCRPPTSRLTDWRLTLYVTFVGRGTWPPVHHRHRPRASGSELDTDAANWSPRDSICARARHRDVIVVFRALLSIVVGANCPVATVGITLYYGSTKDIKDENRRNPPRTYLFIAVFRCIPKLLSCCDWSILGHQKELQTDCYCKTYILDYRVHSLWLNATNEIELRFIRARRQTSESADECNQFYYQDH